MRFGGGRASREVSKRLETRRALDEKGLETKPCFTGSRTALGSSCLAEKDLAAVKFM